MSRSPFKVAGVEEAWRPEGPRFPQLLREKIARYEIPRGAFRFPASFSRVLVYQIPPHEGDTFKGSVLVKSEKTKKREEMEAPRGILLSAGLGALDYLRAHGYEIGHTVWFVRLSPWRLPADSIGGREITIVPLDVDSLRGSEELAADLDSGRCRYVWSEKDREHQLEKDGVLYPRTLPPVAEDY